MWNSSQNFKMKSKFGSTIESVETYDIRFPTSLQGDGSDAIHSDPDYSVCYVVITTSDGQKGFGLTFTLGKGTNIVCSAVKTMKFLLENVSLDEIFDDFGIFWRKLTSDSQLRWVFQISTIFGLNSNFNPLSFSVGARKRCHPFGLLCYYKRSLGPLGKTGRKTGLAVTH
jgi:hypothetical protein